MNDFFEAPPPQPETRVEEAEGPVWFQPPRGVLPCAVPLAEVIARNDQVAIGIAGALAYTTGFELKFIVILARTAARDLGDLDPFDYRHRGGQRDGELSPEMLRLGIEYSDGRKSMNTNPRWPEFDEDEEDESKPTMIEHDGGGGEREWRQSVWCWPLPSPGPLQLVCEWPSMEIPLTRHEIDAQLILDAAERAQEVFPSE